jgi:alkylation response protein AidB-like acyl-CoA dehydrogenase
MSDLGVFRDQTRAWLEANCPVSMRTPMPSDEMVWGGREIQFKHEDQKLWFERMRDKGWFCPDWPQRYGGGGLTSQELSVLESEMRRLHCRPPQINLGIWMLGPVLLEFGSEEQKLRFLPPMARGEIRWCQGFSEPNAGSDLASLRTSAVLDGDDYVINGTKIWTSYGNKSDWMYALVRTGPMEPRQAGISLIVLDMKSPGVSVSPIDLISGKSTFCQVFFDNVRVPRDQLIGEVNGGWALGKALLQHERRAMSKFSEFALPTHFDLDEYLNRFMPDPAGSAEQALYGRAVACLMDE